MNKRDGQRQRDASGRYEVEQRCDCCTKPIHGEHVTDDEACAGSDGPGFYLCSRVRCGKKYEALGVEGRRAMFAAGRAKSAAV